MNTRVGAISLQTLAISAATLGLVVGMAIVTAGFARADAGPTIGLNVRDTSNAVVASAPLGSVLYASTTVATSSTAVNPTGTVVFSLFNNLSCAGTAATSSGSLVSGTAQSGTTSLTAAGLSYKVHYNGDATSTPADSQCVSVSVTPVPPVPTPVPPLPGLGTISGVVFNDLNRDHKLTPGEPGIVGFTIKLHLGNKNKSPVIATTTTNASGAYTFSGLALGTYYVEEINMSGWKQTTSDSKVKVSSTISSKILNFASKVLSTTTKSHKDVVHDVLHTVTSQLFGHEGNDDQGGKNNSNKHNDN